MTDKPKHPGGRPTKYNDQLLKDTVNYIENFKDFEDVIPSIAGLACVLGVARETIHAWDREEGKEQFSLMLRNLLSKQERILVNMGLGGGFNPNITKLVLTKHGYSDKTDANITGFNITIGDKDAESL